MFSSPAAVLFDLDGTLLDTADDLAACLNQLLTEEALPPIAPEVLRQHVSNGANAMLNFAYGVMSEQDARHRRERLLAIYEQNIARHTTWFPGMERLVQQLKTQGVGWGIVTNKPRHYTQLLLSAMQIEPDTLVCPDDLGVGKPSPAPLYLACRNLNADPEKSIYIGDHIRDIEAGRAAGMKTIAAAYGYIQPEDDPTLWQADVVINLPEQLMELLLNR